MRAADVTCIQEYCGTVLCRAARRRRNEMCELLIIHKADVNESVKVGPVCLLYHKFDGLSFPRDLAVESFLDRPEH